MTNENVREFFTMSEQDSADWQLIAPGKALPTSKEELVRVGRQHYQPLVDANLRNLAYLADLAQAANRLGLVEQAAASPARMVFSVHAGNDPR